VDWGTTVDLTSRHRTECYGFAFHGLKNAVYGRLQYITPFWVRKIPIAMQHDACAEFVKVWVSGQAWRNHLRMRYIIIAQSSQALPDNCVG